MKAALQTQSQAEVWLPASEVQRRGMSRSSLYRGYMSGRWVWRDGESGERELLLSSLPSEISACTTRFREVEQPDTPELPKTADPKLLVSEAGRRWVLLQRWAELSRRDRLGELGAEIREEYSHAPRELVDHCPSLGDVPHPGSLDRTLKRCRQLFDAGQNGALATLGRIGLRRTERDPVLPEAARAYILRLWLCERVRTKKTIERTYRAEAKRRGWPVVSYSTIRRLVNSCPGGAEFLARRGRVEYEGVAAPFIVRSHEDLVAGEILNGDHHEFDFFVRDESTGRLFRPWLTAWLDLGSRALQGWHICQQPSSTTIKEAFVHAIRPKRRPEYQRMCGLPRGVYVDNGKDYRCHDLEGRSSLVSKAQLGDEDLVVLRGLFPQLQVGVTHARVRNAKAKPVERFFLTVAMDFSPRLPGYCGSNAKEKRAELFRELTAQHKAWLAGERSDTPFLTLAEVQDLWERWLYQYHHQAHDSLSTGGRELAPVDVYRLRGREPELLGDRTVELLLMERRIATIQKNGVKLDGVWYFHELLAELYRPGDRGKVQCRRDPEDAGRLYIFDLHGAFLCEAVNVPVLLAGATTEEVREAHRRVKDYAKAQMRAIEVLPKAAPEDGWSTLDVLRETVPPEPSAPEAPANAIRRMTPELDRVPLRQVEPPRQPAEEILVLDEAKADVRPAAKPRLTMWDWEEEEEATPISAAGGRGETR